MIRKCLPEEEEASWSLEERVWALFHQEAEGGAPSEYFQNLHLVAVSNKKIVGTIDACPFEWSEKPEDLKGWADMVRSSDSFPLDFVPGGTEGLWAGAIGTSIDPEYREGGLSTDLLLALKEKALLDGYKGLIAPVRPIFKTRAPYLSIEEYSKLRLPSGKHFDPWVRAHESLGGEIIATREHSASFRGSIEDWERWTKMKLPDSGQIIIPGAAGPLMLAEGRGEVVEPSIWIVHASGE